MPLIHPTYFPNIAHFATIATADNLCFEVCDNYQKQTYRNRCDIYGANGKLSLTVPVSYTQKQRQLYKDVRIANEDKWQLQHLKSIQSSYRMSPFYEYYEDDLMPLFELKADFILDFNLKCFEILCDCLQIGSNYNSSTVYEKHKSVENDYRALVNTKNQYGLKFQDYVQVFTQKHNYISNLSILDLLFNEGPNTITYLEAQKLPL
jgi:hypothetical protein